MASVLRMQKKYAKVITALTWAALPILAVATDVEPILNYSSTQCATIDYKYFKPINAESLESIYCGYKMVLKSSGKNLHLYSSGNFSTQENIEGNVMWQRATILKSCEENQLQTLSLLKTNYPSLLIDCDKYKDFDDGSFEKNILNLSTKSPARELAEDSEIIVMV